MHNIVPQLPRIGLKTLALVLIEAAVVLTFATSNSQAQSLGGANWKQIGPAPLIIDPPEGADPQSGPDSGQVTDIAIDPRGLTDQTIYIATGSGGIWKTTNGGATWTPKTDFMPTLEMGAVALDPGNPSIVYAGTGNAYSFGLKLGKGIYRSIDGGDSWPFTLGNNIFSGQIINKIVLPAPNLLLVATDIGVYRSVDGGVNFGNNAPLFNNNSPIIGGYVTDLDVDTASSTIVYASIPGSGLFRSTDSGATFPTAIATGNGAGNLFSGSNGAPANPGYISFTQSTLPNNQTMYVNVILTNNIYPNRLSMFKSTNGGGTWSQITLNGDIGKSPQEGNPYLSYCQTIGVDPQDANRVFIGLRALYMATDGGATG
ncbi:MAG: hypothetical protein WCN98_15635, partial [Verrucomicrobiaceae bacterium]